MTRICLLSAALLAGTSGIAHAQSVEEGESSDRVIVVTATGQSSATSTTKTSTPIIESPQSISIVSREEMLESLKLRLYPLTFYTHWVRA